MAETDPIEPTRREFIKAATLTVAGAAPIPLASAQNGAGCVPPVTPDVVQVSSDYVVRGRRVHDAVLRDMLHAALACVTGAENSKDAWRSLLREDDVVGLKFNRCGAAGLGVSWPLAEAVVSSLLESGFEERRIVAVEAPDGVHTHYGVGGPVPGWNNEPTHFASGSDHLARVLDQVTAIINLPFLKTHRIAGITCCLKNLSHGLIKHPARFHGSHCSPYIADIVALPQIRGKLRLNLVNALRVVFDGGPEVRDQFTWDAGMILASTHPVETDTLGLQIVNSQRVIVGLPAIDPGSRHAAHIRAAALRGLGNDNPHRLQVSRIRV